MKRALVLFATLLWLLSAAVAGASEQSKLLYSRGLVEFHAERYQPALELFEQAVAADPADVYARYYRAVTRARLNDLDGAISDLREVLAAKPDLAQAALDLGVALVEKHQYRDALPWLTQAQQSADLDGQASQFIGIANLRLGHLETARRNFVRAASRDAKQTVPARYYQGIVDYREGNWLHAQKHFTFVAIASPDSDVGREAKAFLDKIAASRPARFQGYATVGFQYDSNVILAPSNGDLATQATKDLNVTGQSDGRATIGFGGVYSAFRTDSVELLLAYDFFQSLHFQLQSFNLQDHGPSLQLSARVGRVQYGIVGRYDYYLLDSSSFLQEATALPWLTVAEGAFGRIESFYRMRRRDFKDPDFAVRDAFNHAIGIRQFIYLNSPDRYLLLGYQFDREDPLIAGQHYSTRGVSSGISPQMYADDARSFGYDGNEVRAGVGWLLPQQITSEATFIYRRERYRPESHGRRDDEEEVLVALRRPISHHLDVNVAYLGDFNNSSNQFFDYDRHVVSLALEARF